MAECAVVFDPIEATPALAKRFGVRIGDIYGQSRPVEVLDCKRLLGIPVEPESSGDIPNLACACPNGQVLTARPTFLESGDVVWEATYRTEPCRCLLFVAIRGVTRCPVDHLVLPITEDVNGITEYPMDWRERPIRPCYRPGTSVSVTFPAEVACERDGVPQLHRYVEANVGIPGCRAFETQTSRTVTITLPTSEECFPCSPDFTAFYELVPPPRCPMKGCEDCLPLNVRVSLNELQELTDRDCGGGCTGTVPECAGCQELFCDEWPTKLEETMGSVALLDDCCTASGCASLSCCAEREIDLRMGDQRCGPFPHPDPDDYWLGWSSLIKLGFSHQIEFDYLRDCSGRTRARIGMTALVFGFPFEQWDHTVNYCFPCPRPYFGGEAIELPSGWMDFGILNNLAHACETVRHWVEEQNPWTFLDVSHPDSRFIKLDFSFA